LEGKRPKISFNLKEQKLPKSKLKEQKLLKSKLKKRHTLTKFVRETAGTAGMAQKFLGTGTAQKFSSSQVRRVLASLGRENITVKALGSPKKDMPNESQSQSLLVELEMEDTELSRLVESTKILMEESKVRNEEIDSMKKKLDQILVENHHTQLFLEDGYEVAVRAFLDKVLETFYEVAGVRGTTEEKATWLRSREAKFFCRGQFIPFKEFGSGGLYMDLRVLKCLRRARRESSELSATTCHSSKPIKVAIGLQQLDQFKNSEDFSWLFHQIFKIAASDMKKQYDAGE
jgi:hypothetical protein